MKISVIIPTRERAEFLGACLQSALAIEDADVEIVVSDNASRDHTAQVLDGFDDPRLKRLDTGARVSMRENFNRALEASSGDYFLFIGDDDAVLPRQFPYLRRLLEQHRPDGLSWNRATYGWPIEGFGAKTGGVRFYRNALFAQPAEYDPSRHRADLLSCRLNALDPAPRIYHGCASRSYIERQLRGDGLFFDSAIPDVNFEYRAILTGGRFVHCGHVLSINGYSPVSTGSAHAGSSTGAPGAKAGKAFSDEVKADPVKDVMEHALSVPLAFFSTLETVRAKSGFEDARPDYAAWYRYVLSAGRGNPDLSRRLEAILSDHAARSGTEAELEAGRDAGPRRKRSLAERLSRLRAQAASFRLSAHAQGLNTVRSAAHVYDEVLGTDYGRVLDGAISPRAAWRAARQRARGFTRQL